MLSAPPRRSVFGSRHTSRDGCATSRSSPRLRDLLGSRNNRRWRGSARIPRRDHLPRCLGLPPAAISVQSLFTYRSHQLPAIDIRPQPKYVKPHGVAMQVSSDVTTAFLEANQALPGLSVTLE